MLRRYFFVISCLLSSSWGFAQDPQYSQFYAAPLYLNPAFAGSAFAPRGIINYRNQWPALSANYVTSSVSFDYYFDKYRSGVGLLVMNDTQFSNLKSTEIGLQYSYNLKIDEDHFARFGLQASSVTRSADFYQLTFGDQLTDRGPNGRPSLDPVANTGPQVSYADFSTGVLTYSRQWWAGLSVHHLNRPQQSFIAGQTEHLPMKFSFHAGYRIPLDAYQASNGLGADFDREISISPAIMYKRQGTFDQLDAGIYFTFEPLVLGAWYRGIPIKQYKQGINNHDALVFLVGYRQDHFSFGYSYDATISTLGMASGGSHEISISYLFDNITKKKRPKAYKKRELSCPKF